MVGCTLASSSGWPVVSGCDTEGRSSWVVRSVGNLGCGCLGQAARSACGGPARHAPGCRSLDRPYAAATARHAHRIRATASSGCSPNSCATWPVQPWSPNRRRVVAMAWRTCRALGCSDRCSADTNSASARAAQTLGQLLVGGIAGLLGADHVGLPRRIVVASWGSLVIWAWVNRSVIHCLRENSLVWSV